MMEETSGKTVLQQSQQQLGGPENVCSKRKYTTPHLIEYGDFAKLTQSGGIGGADAMAMSPCL